MVRPILVLVMAALLCTGVARAQRLLPDEQSKHVIDAIEKSDTKTLLQLYAGNEDLDARLSTGDTPLSVASALGQAAVVQLLLERGADVNVVSGHGWTPLMVAIFYGNHDIAKILLANHAKVDVRGEDGATPRSLAIWRGDVELAALMPPEAPRQPVADDLVSAVLTGGGQKVDTLLASGVPPTASDEKGIPVIVSAAAIGDLGSLDKLLKAGAPADLAGPNGVTPLMVAVQQGQTKIIDRLLVGGADPAKRGPNGTSAIAIADAMGKPELAGTLRAKATHGLDDEGSLASLAAAAAAGDRGKVAALVAGGVNPNGGLVRGKQVIPLSIAAFRGKNEIVDVLLSSGVSVDVTDADGITPLMSAIAGNQQKVAFALVEHGASTTARSKSGLTPRDMARAAGWLSLGNTALISSIELNEATKRGDVQTVRAILATNMGDALIKRPDERGWYPLMYAAENGNDDIVQLLLNNDAPLEPAGSGTGIPSPLMIAASAGKLDVVDMLLSQGANPMLRWAGKTAEDVAREKGFRPVVSRLQAGTKDYARRVNAALVSLGFLANGGNTWGDQNTKALNSFYATFTALGPQKGSDAASLAEALARTRRVCNETTEAISLAIVSNPNATDGGSQKVSGWYILNSGSCNWISVKTSSSVPFPPVWIYGFSGKSEWTGFNPLCLLNGQMSGYRAIRGLQCEEGQRLAGFLELGPESPNPYVFKSRK